MIAEATAGSGGGQMCSWAWNRLRNWAEPMLLNRGAGNIIATSNKSQNASAQLGTVSWHQAYRRGISEEEDLAATCDICFTLGGLDEFQHESSDSTVPLCIVATVELNEVRLEILPKYMTIQLMPRAGIY